VNSKCELPQLSFWVVPGRFLAGQHPYGGTGRLLKILDAGIDTFMSLQPAGERIGEDYSRALYCAAVPLHRKVDFLRRPIPDTETCSPETMAEILDEIDSVLELNRNIFVHCRAGNGRTGLVVGCWLVRHGLSSEEALCRIEELRNPDAELRSWPSPSTWQQCEMVRRWESFEGSKI
jgi:hypothetical protein